MDNGYKKYMMLKIRRVNKSDFGSYKCVAKNSLGETDGVIKLEGKLILKSILFDLKHYFVIPEIPAPTTLKTTTQLPSLPTKKKGKNNNNKTVFFLSLVAFISFVVYRARRNKLFRLDILWLVTLVNIKTSPITLTARFE